MEKLIEDQLKKSRWFISKYQQQSDNHQDFDENNNHMGGAAQAAIEENAHIPGEKELKGGKEEDKKDDYISKVKK